MYTRWNSERKLKFLYINSKISEMFDFSKSFKKHQFLKKNIEVKGIIFD